eukprot:TRINITY_DN110246_c0_g1_i1.p1 TRINITY_DN110246_c0_g1~~TRINITY_DN110246_c0_g1_i1.p1  ORF type:complete len:326 (-),score=19.18 TRINITY_DN110246_c0_g1_i1:564-1472(-)
MASDLGTVLAIFVASVSFLLHGCSPSGSGSGPDNPSRSKVCSDPYGHHTAMSCGEGVRLCGVLTLQAGLGSGVYHHDEPNVHGLWPEVHQFGNSECVKPGDPSAPSKLYSCYDQKDTPRDRDMAFQKHEWEKHGVCAGAKNADDFLQQVCNLAEGPLRVMRGARAARMDLSDTVDALQRSRYCVWSTSTQKQIELSTCAGSDGRWVLADVNDFPKVCGHGGGPSPAPSPSKLQCVPGHHGPKCETNVDCTSASGCVRCAKSGYCTDIPLAKASRHASFFALTPTVGTDTAFNLSEVDSAAKS